MAYRELTLNDIGEMLRRWHARQSVRQIARDTGIDRKTVRRYIARAKEALPENATELNDEHLSDAARVARSAVRAPRPWRVELRGYRAQLAHWLEGPRPLSLRSVHALLEHRGVRVTYWSLRRFVIDELGWHRSRADLILTEPSHVPEGPVSAPVSAAAPDSAGSCPGI